MTDKNIEQLVAALIAAEHALNTAPRFRCRVGDSYSIASYICHVLSNVPADVMEGAEKRFNNYENWVAVNRNVYEWEGINE
jgi:hypothetical protein